MKERYSHLKIKVLKNDFQYSLLDSDTDVSLVFQKLQSNKEPCSLFISEDEISLIAPACKSLHFNAQKTEAGWSCFCIIGPMPFGSVQGLIATISAALLNENIGVCVVSSFKSDWFFIRNKYQEKAISLLTKEGWYVERE